MKSGDLGFSVDEKAWDEWKYRHDLFHKLQFRYTGVVAILCSLPFFKPGDICESSIPVEIFGWAALVLGIIGFTHMIWEFTRVIHCRIMCGVFSKESFKYFQDKHPFYAKLATINFEKIMWLMSALFLLGFPLVLLIYGQVNINCNS